MVTLLKAPFLSRRAGLLSLMMLTLVSKAVGLARELVLLREVGIGAALDLYVIILA